MCPSSCALLPGAPSSPWTSTCVSQQHPPLSMRPECFERSHTICHSMQMRALRAVIASVSRKLAPRHQVPCSLPLLCTLYPSFSARCNTVFCFGSPKYKACTSNHYRHFSNKSSPFPVLEPPDAPAAAAKTSEPEHMVAPPAAFDNMRSAIIARSSRSVLRVFASAVLAGGLLATSCSVVIAVVGVMPVAIGIQKLIAGLLFPAGLSMILFLQADLLTS